VETAQQAPEAVATDANAAPSLPLLQKRQ
jgi:hypothetical protein